MKMLEFIRNIGPYDFEITDAEAQGLLDAARQAVGPMPQMPHIFDTEGRRQYSERWIAPLVEHVSSGKVALKNSR